MWIIDVEEAHLTDWPEAQRSRLDAQIKDGDILRASSQLFLQGGKMAWQEGYRNIKNMMEGCKNMVCFFFFYSKLQH